MVSDLALEFGNRPLGDEAQGVKLIEPIAELLDVGKGVIFGLVDIAAPETLGEAGILGFWIWDFGFWIELLASTGF